MGAGGTSAKTSEKGVGTGRMPRSYLSRIFLLCFLFPCLLTCSLIHTLQAHPSCWHLGPLGPWNPRIQAGDIKHVPFITSSLLLTGDFSPSLQKCPSCVFAFAPGSSRPDPKASVILQGWGSSSDRMNQWPPASADLGLCFSRWSGDSGPKMSFLCANIHRECWRRRATLQNGWHSFP